MTNDEKILNAIKKSDSSLQVLGRGTVSVSVGAVTSSSVFRDAVMRAASVVEKTSGLHRHKIPAKKDAA